MPSKCSWTTVDQPLHIRLHLFGYRALYVHGVYGHIPVTIIRLDEMNGSKRGGRRRQTEQVIYNEQCSIGMDLAVQALPEACAAAGPK
jgi:hypothetical protein